MKILKGDKVIIRAGHKAVEVVMISNCLTEEGLPQHLVMFDKDSSYDKYIVAFYPTFYQGELTWNQGRYFGDLNTALEDFKERSSKFD